MVLSTYPSILDEPPSSIDVHGLSTQEPHGQLCRHNCRCAFTTPSHPYHNELWRLFSSAGLCPCEHLPVRKLGALCCPDFPLRPLSEATERPTVVLFVNNYHGCSKSIFFERCIVVTILFVSSVECSANLVF